MKKITTNLVGCIVASIFLDLIPMGAWGQDSFLSESRLELHAELQNLLLFRDDSDFDRSPPKYDENGQTVGAFATLFRPAVMWHITNTLRIFYEAELGLNYWSKQNPDEQDALAPDVFVLKHRQIYGQGEFLDDTLGFKVGYSYFRDTTGLFLAHWIGVAQMFYNWSSDDRVGVFFGEVPDQTYEGINVQDNNFQRDILVFGLSSDLKLSDDLRLSAGVHNLYDTHLVDQTRWVICPNLHLEGTFDSLSYFVEAAMQFGESTGTGLGGEDQTILAWAAQGHLGFDFSPFELEWNLLALSPDDAHEDNSQSYAFLYSAKSKSATLILTEDEIRDWYDNLDERMSDYQGGFFTNRAGFLVTDVKFAWNCFEWFKPALVLGAGFALKPANAMDHMFVGVEGDLILEFNISKHLIAHVVFGGVLPGEAGAAKINQIRLDATDPIGMIETSLMIRY